MGDYRNDCCEPKDCCCRPQNCCHDYCGSDNGIWMIILIVVILLLCCGSNDGRGGLFGGLF